MKVLLLTSRITLISLQNTLIRVIRLLARSRTELDIKALIYDYQITFFSRRPGRWCEGRGLTTASLPNTLITTLQPTLLGEITTSPNFHYAVV